MLRKPWFYVVVVIALIAFVVVFFRQGDTETDVEVPISTLITDVSIGRVRYIEIRGDELDVELIDLSHYKTTKEEGVSLFTLFADRGIDASNVVIEVKERSALGGWLGLLLNFLPVLLLMTFVIYVVKLAKKR